MNDLDKLLIIKGDYTKMRDNNECSIIEFHRKDGRKSGIANERIMRLLIDAVLAEVDRLIEHRNG